MGQSSQCPMLGNPHPRFGTFEALGHGGDVEIRQNPQANDGLLGRAESLPKHRIDLGLS